MTLSIQPKTPVTARGPQFGSTRRPPVRFSLRAPATACAVAARKRHSRKHRNRQSRHVKYELLLKEVEAPCLRSSRMRARSSASLI